MTTTHAQGHPEAPGREHGFAACPAPLPSLPQGSVQGERSPIERALKISFLQTFAVRTGTSRVQAVTRVQLSRVLRRKEW